MSILFTGAFIDLKEKENHMRVRNKKNHAWTNILPWLKYQVKSHIDTWQPWLLPYYILPVVQVEKGWVEYGDSAGLRLK